MRFLNLQKQQFLKDAYSLLIDFGKIIDRAQEDIDAEIAAEAPEHRDYSPEPALEQPEEPSNDSYPPAQEED